MGYDLHITRKADWAAQGPDISLEEWERVVESDASLALTGAVEAPLPNGGSLRYENAGLALWKGHSTGGEGVPFDFRDGQVVVKNPDREILHKMLMLAETLEARVVGDDGEAYSYADLLRADFGEESAPATPPARRASASAAGIRLLSVALLAGFIGVLVLVVWLRGPLQGAITIAVAVAVYLLQKNR